VADAGGFAQYGWRDWIDQSDLAGHAQRRSAPDSEEAIQASKDPMCCLWRQILRDLESFGVHVTQDQDHSVLCGPPTSRYGSPLLRSGRWKTPSQAPDGDWLGWQRSNQGRPKPLAVKVTGGRIRKALTLYDVDEWLWAHQSRGIAVGEPEYIELDENNDSPPKLRSSCPLPTAFPRAVRPPKRSHQS
jgi:hypothetical protein